ncbi:serine/threonine-protein kinase [Candidatus Uabimicrobium amorphum]|uniref:non-specific serine/threonine protein kinase n=1 Tax=Uabimicrobium amorphum TaxID=2596890 RepID=A0A5S9IIX1_UABAM|nr:serine/threonine-protein kinase [Candidatus Uabimicrobium amorphum]BBM82377.1 protein kinase [Candidatus Uabimicrobium amorphum]
MSKEKLKKLIAKGILTPQQASQYLRESSHIPLRNWLIDNRYLNEGRWKQIFPKENVALPHSFVLDPQNPPVAPPKQQNVSEDHQTKDQVFVPKTHNTFRHYKMDKKLGEGGMGKVYKAVDTITGRVVALKFISSQFITQNDHKRFFQEVRAISRLEHDNIVKLYEVGEQPTLYYAMEYVEGKTLKDVHKLSYKQIADILRQVAVALDYAHEKNIIHRDIKPDNIILSDKYQAKLTDFGLAKDTEIQSSISRTGNIVGTPAFLSPEQVQGAKVTPQSDIYSLGATLYYILTGQPPFRDESFVSLFFDILHTTPPSPRRIKKEIPKDLESICLQCLEKKAEHRYATSQKLADDLQNFIDEKPVYAGKNVWRTTTHYLHKFTMRKGLLFLVFCNVFLLALVGENVPRSLSVATPDRNKDKDSVPNSDFAKVETSHKLDDGTFTQEIIDFGERSRFLWDPYHRGMLFYKMREKNSKYQRKAKNIWNKGVTIFKDNEKKATQLKYQLFYMDMIAVMYKKNWAGNPIRLLHKDCRGIMATIENFSDKSPVDVKILRNCRQFNEVLQIIRDYKREYEGNKSQAAKRAFFDSQRRYGGYENLFLALQGTQRLSNQIKFLHEALNAIPYEELVYVELLKVYREAGFYEEAEALYDHLRENINPHLLSADVEMLAIYMSHGKIERAKQILDKLKNYEIFASSQVQILYAQYLFLVDKNDDAQSVLKKLPKGLTVKENNLRAIIQRGLVGKTVGDQNVLLQAAKLYILKDNIALAKKYITYVENKLAREDRAAEKKSYLRTKANLYRTQLLLYRSELRNKRMSLSQIREFNTKLSDVGGHHEKFKSLIAGAYFAIDHNLSFDVFIEPLQQRCDEHTFFRIRGDYFFRDKKYLDAIGYWESSIHALPFFHDYLAEKQLKALEALNAK